MSEYYTPADYGKKEEDFMRLFYLQRDDAKLYFLQQIKPRLDRAYKLYIAYNGDRAREIKSWQANIFVPYTNAVIETLMPRILDARPEFTVSGRNQDDQLKAEKLQSLCDYSWEKSGMDSTSEMLVRSSLIYGTGFLQVSWKKDVRKNKFLVTKDLATKKKLKWEEREQVFYDAPYAEWVDNYALWYDWHNIQRASKQFWFKRLILSGAEIKRKYPSADPERLKKALARPGGDLTDYGSIRNEVKSVHEKTVKGADFRQSAAGSTLDIYNSQPGMDEDTKMYEVFEWLRPFADTFAVIVNEVPILRGGYIPNPYDFKETPFIDFPYLKLPNEFEGYGLPMILENPQLMLNMIKNQRLDAATLNIHKMWIVNPLANIDKSELVTRPFGIVYSTDPNGVREIEFSDIKPSAYKEDELLKDDMRYASGVDDFSMGVGGNAGSATEVRHLRESTLERVRLFINHLGDGFATMQRYWISMQRQFMSKSMTIRIVGPDGAELFPIVEKDDLMGEFDFKASVIPSIAGKGDIEKKQGMDLFQLLVNLPFVDPRKLTAKVLGPWNWSLDSVAKEEEAPAPGMPGMPGAEGAPGGMPQLPGMEGQAPGGMPQLPGMEGMQPPTEAGPPSLPQLSGNEIPADVLKNAVAMLGGQPAEAVASPFSEAAMPIDLLQAGGLPPTAPKIGQTTNPRGMNRTGKVNTNIPVNANYGDSTGNILNQANNLQS